jgi:antitoxin PrlF
MSIATLTGKGQITLPKALRSQLNLKAGDRLKFEAQPDGSLLARPASRSALDLIGLLRQKGKRAVSVTEMNRAIASELKTKHRPKARSGKRK